VSVALHQGDCIEVMRGMAAASVDAVVCDPPYGLEFMGKDWDRLGDVTRALRGETSGLPIGEGSGRGTSPTAGRPGFDLTAQSQRAMQEWHEAWAREALRVLKPGGHLLAFGGTRTSHRLVCAVEDAGFEIRDSVVWLYGSGFPKSLDVSKAIDKAVGAERDVIGPSATHTTKSMAGGAYGANGEREGVNLELTAPATADAMAWDGWGTALKPAHEPICVARKPLSGTVAGNVLEHGTGALHIDACRINGAEPHHYQAGRPSGDASFVGRGNSGEPEPFTGRWPANVMLSHDEACVLVGTKRVKGQNPVMRNDSALGGYHGLSERKAGTELGYADADGMETVEEWECVEGCAVRMLDEQTGVLTSGALDRSRITAPNLTYGARPKTLSGTYDPDSGGASRFFYCAKASGAERNAGLDGFDEQRVKSYEGAEIQGRSQDAEGEWQNTGRERQSRRNVHPTVKPVDVMRWLVRLVTPPGGVVLDPFLGSGTTGIAAIYEDCGFIGIEKDTEHGYMEIARARIARAEARRALGLPFVQPPEPAVKKPIVGQLDLLG
jgi:site-specific DNA-methyltransferase (adenine-specific)